MADIRIKDIATEAGGTDGSDFLAVDGSLGTRKISPANLVQQFADVVSVAGNTGVVTAQDLKDAVATAFVQTLMADTDDTAFLTTLGFSTFMQGLRDDADQAAARATLGAQAADATLTALAGLSTAAGVVPRFTGTDVVEAMAVTTFSKTYLDDTTGDDVCTTIGAARLNQFTSGTPTSAIAWYKFPDGTIEQRGSSVVTTDSSGVVVITFPTGFSGARSYTMVVTNGDFDSSAYVLGIMSNNDWPQATATLVFVRDLSTGAPVASTTLRVDWLAVGR